MTQQYRRRCGGAGVTLFASVAVLATLSVVLFAAPAICAQDGDTLGVVAHDNEGGGATPAVVTYVPRRPSGCRPSLSDPRTCSLAGRRVYYRNRQAVRRGGVWYKSKSSAMRWTAGKWTRARVVRHPTDPRYVRVAGRWVRRTGRGGKAKGKGRYVRRGKLWWRSAKMRRYWNRGAWRKPYWLQRANSPNYRKVAGRWVKRRRTVAGARLWNGLWRRGNQAYWQGRWRPLGKVLGDDPNFRRLRAGKWVNDALSRPTPYVVRYGRWFRKGSNMVFRNRKWVRYGRVHDNDPRYRRTRRGRWVKVPGAGKAFQRKGNAWYRPGNQVYRHGRWISASKYRTLARGKIASKVLARGELPSGMREAVKAQVKVNFSRFIKWFISNYLRGGNNLDARRRIRAAAVRVTDAFNPQPYQANPGEPEAVGASTRGPPPTKAWLVDAALRKSKSSRAPGSAKRGTAGGPRGIVGSRATIHWAETNAAGQAGGVFGVQSDAVSDNRGVQKASFLAESGSESEADQDEGDDSDDFDDVGNESADGVGAAGGPTSASDPTMPSQLNGGGASSVVSSDPSIAAGSQV